jgi:hypothetical protein
MSIHCERVLDAYIECALWASTDAEGEPMDTRYTRDDIAPEALASMREDVENFCDDALDTDATQGVSEIPDSQIGHDFWLTRNGHGAGFWDRGLGKLGDDLTALCRPYGESDLYVGDDGKVYVYPHA